MGTVNKALKKANQELLTLIKIKPMTEEIKAGIGDLRETIVQYGVSGIFKIFYELCHLFIYVILVLYFLYDLIN